MYIALYAYMFVCIYIFLFIYTYTPYSVHLCGKRENETLLKTNIRGCSSVHLIHTVAGEVHLECSPDLTNKEACTKTLSEVWAVAHLEYKARKTSGIYASSDDQGQELAAATNCEWPISWSIGGQL